MNINRFIILAAVLIFGICSAPAGIGAYAYTNVPVSAKAMAARAENAQSRIYTPYELGCMAQYYYKRTNEKGICPPETDCQLQEDGSYLITLFEKKVDKNENPYFTTYAQYSMGTDGRGQDLSSGKEIDLTLYSKVYTPEELCKLAQNYYYEVNDFYPPNAEATANSDGTYTICLFETIDDDGGTAHNATCGWITVNICGLGTDDMTMGEVDING